MGLGPGQGLVGRVGQDRIERGGVCAGGSVAYLDIVLKISGYCFMISGKSPLPLWTSISLSAKFCLKAPRIYVFPNSLDEYFG